MTVMWLTNRNTTGYVEYGEPGAAPRRAFSSRHGLRDANQRIHRVPLTGLKPGTLYRYKAVSQDILNYGANKVQYGQTASSAEFEFRTLDRRKRAFSFLMFNDIHGNATVMPELLAVAGAAPYDLVVLNGDVLSSIADERQIIAILDSAVKLFASRIPLVWVRGNHETRGPFARVLPDYLASPGGSFYYSFDHGPAHFTVLDTGEDKADSHVEYSGLADFEAYRKGEREWLAGEVKSPAYREAAFRIGLAHMPFAEATGPWGGTEDAYRNFGDLLNASGLDLMLSAHRHVPAVVEPDGPAQVSDRAGRRAEWQPANGHPRRCEARYGAGRDSEARWNGLGRARSFCPIITSAMRTVLLIC